jgi:hypothetical protein
MAAVETALLYGPPAAASGEPWAMAAPAAAGFDAARLQARRVPAHSHSHPIGSRGSAAPAPS